VSKYQIGAKGEFVVAEMLKADGWRIAHASNLDGIAGNNGAPLVRGDDDRKIMPDIHAMKDGRTVWVEVKLKRSGAEFIHKNDQYEHFIDAPNWKAYNEVQSASGCEVWLVIIEVPEQTVRRQLVEEVDVVGFWSETDVKQCGGAKYGGEGVFVPQADFMPIALPAPLSGEIAEQRQLEGTVDPGEEVLPDVTAEDDDTVDIGQHGLSDFATDGGESND
jgi:Holliday junction resolvase-like predicted endonuclease